MSERRSRGRRAVFNSPANIQRTLAPFDLSHRVATTFKVGFLQPVEIREVLPGDERRSSLEVLARLTPTFVRPIMDNLYLDLYEFFVPLRLLQDNLEDVFGNNSPSSYTQNDAKAEIAHWTNANGSNPSGAGSAGTIADYLGAFNHYATNHNLPGGTSVLPFRAIPLIWNNYFRNQNYQPETYVYKTSSPVSTEKLNNSAWSATNYTGQCPMINRYRDYFSTAVPRPQKGDPVLIPISELGKPFLNFEDNTLLDDITIATGSSSVSRGDKDYIAIQASNGSLNEATSIAFEGKGGVDVNALRTGVQFQKYKEREMIYGSRYFEYIRAAYGVDAPGARLQIPEPLGSSHTRLNVSQVVTTGQGDDYDVGQVAAMSQTFNHTGRWSRRFSEHGYIVTLGCIRYKHLYSNGMHRLWSRTKFSDFYDPLFQNLSYQRIFKNEIFANGNTDWKSSESQTFGYQEPFLDMRTVPDHVTGQMRPASGSLGQFWSLADSFPAQPTVLDVVTETQAPFDRVVTTPHEEIDPFIVDLYFHDFARRVVGSDATPGLMDHH